MKESYRITKAEREVMEVIWEAAEPVRTKTLLDKMKERGRDWKRQTLNTLLFRLEEKGIVSRRRAYVEGALSEDELLQKQTQEILDDFYGGKLENFCAALVGNQAIKDDDVDKLYALIDEWRTK
ncbi:MAG: BlaI/MecI/CopY family transcriptional regulator [Lachnospiraceae bacterium]|nr:BlaI/MecI/CopY family transcriptional regulator [Lachnospiraceae bacterium]